LPDQAPWQEHCQSIEQASTFSDLIWSVLQAGLWIARSLAEAELHRRAHQSPEHSTCQVCGGPMCSKGFRQRQMTCLLGQITWKRQVRRCVHGCPGSQRIPLDEALGIRSYQSVDEGFLRLGCLMSVVMPYELASWLMGQWSGVSLSRSTLWNAVQHYGAEAMATLEGELEPFEAAQLPQAEALDAEIAQLPLVISADGVSVPMRPEANTAQGQTQYRECKVGLLVRLGKRMTRAGQSVTHLYQRRVVGVLGELEQFKPRLLLEAHRQSVEMAEQVVWLSDGAKGFWRMYRECFAHCAVGILDFYHGAGHLWKAAAALFDGRSTDAHQWFAQMRHQLRHGQHQSVLSTLTRLINTDHVLSDKELKALINVQAYFQAHHEHIRYGTFEKQGYPLGSGMIESTCKWLIQQRFKGVGMRWSESGFNHLLHLRMAWVNQRFDPLFPQVTWIEHLSSPKL
jgi:hypothetical protein